MDCPTQEENWTDSKQSNERGGRTHMTRSRRPLCGHRDDDHPLYVPRVDPSYVPRARAKVDMALKNLAQVLNALPSPVDGAIADLTARDIAALLSRAPLERRKQALRAIGIPVAPRSVGQALCRDVLARLERAHLHDVMHCATILAWSARRDLFDSATRCRPDGDRPDTIAQWSAATLRFALWTGVLASPADARVLAWAATQPWFLPRTLSEAYGVEVAAAARAVVEATPDFSVDESEEDVTGQSIDQPRVGEAADELNLRGTNVDAATKAPSEGQDGVRASVVVAAERLDELRAERAILEEALTFARTAAHRLVRTLDEGELPTTADIDAITALSDNLRHLAAALSLESPTEPNVSAIDAALVALQQQASQSLVRARIKALRTLDGGPALAEPLAALRSLVDDTLPRLADEDIANIVTGLTALANLVDLIATDGPTRADPQQLMDLQARCASILPPQLALLPIAALTSQLSWTLASAEITENTACDETNSTSLSDAASPALNSTAAMSEQRGVDETSCWASADQRCPQDSPRSRVEPHDGAAPSAETSSYPSSTPSVMPAFVGATAVVPEPPSPDSNINVVATVGDLIVARRFGLAATLAERAGMGESRPTMLRLSALADAVRGETGPCATRLRLELPTLDADLLAADTAALRLAVPALIRVALITGEHSAGALLTTLSARLERNLATISQQVGRRALQGLLIGNPLRTVLADVGELTTQVDQARTAAGEWLKRPRRLRFKRATDIANEWLAADGMIGSLLGSAAADDRSRRAEVTAQMLRLSDHSGISKEIDRLDAKHKGNSGKPLQGAGRQTWSISPPTRCTKSPNG